VICDHTSHTKCESRSFVVVCTKQKHFLSCLRFQRQNIVVIFDNGNSLGRNISLNVTILFRTNLLVCNGKFFLVSTSIACVIQDASLFFQRKDSLNRFVDAIHRDLSGINSSFYAVQDRIHFRHICLASEDSRHQANVNTGFDGTDAGIGFAEVLRNRIHVQGIGYDDAVIVHFVSYKVSKNGFGKRCRETDLGTVFLGNGSFFFNLWILNVCCHQHVYAVVDHFLERNEFTLSEFVQRFVYTRKTCVGVCSGIAMTREMFGSSSDVVLLHTFHGSSCHASYQFRIASVRTKADNRVGRIAVDIGNRCKVYVDAEGTQLASDHFSGLCCSVRASGCTESHVSRKSRSASETVNNTAFLVDCQEQRDVAAVRSACGSFLKIRCQFQCLICLSYIFSEKNNSAEIIILDDLSHFIVHHLEIFLSRVRFCLPFTEIRHHHLGDLLTERHFAHQIVDNRGFSSRVSRSSIYS